MSHIHKPQNRIHGECYPFLLGHHFPLQIPLNSHPIIFIIIPFSSTRVVRILLQSLPQFLLKRWRATNHPASPRRFCYQTNRTAPAPPLVEDGATPESEEAPPSRSVNEWPVVGLLKRLPKRVLTLLSNLPLAIGEMFFIATVMALDVISPGGFLSTPTEAFNTEVRVNKFSLDYYDSGETDWSFSALQILKDDEGSFDLAMAPLQINGDKKLYGTFLPVGGTDSSKVK
ncbi:Cytochrome c biogenesis protein CCS1, chloroplastic-like protein, partial [Drosera capensis]